METKIGLVGCGWAALAHINGLKAVPDARIVAIVDINVARARELATPLGARGYEDYHAMLHNEELDAVYILLPPHLHGEVESACADYVGAVFIEKPVCNNLDTALKVQDAFQKAKTLVSVGYMYRYRSSVERARQLLAQDAPVLVSGWWVGGMPGSQWWRTKSLSGGQFVEQCTHLVDAARWIAGEIVEVSAWGTKKFSADLPDFTGEDAMAVNVRFASGAIGNFSTGCLARAGTDPQDGIWLHLSSQRIQCRFSGWLMKAYIDHRGGWREVIEPEEDMFAVEDGAFVKAIRTGDRSLVRSTYEDAVKTLRVGLAANESCETGRSVGLA